MMVIIPNNGHFQLYENGHGGGPLYPSQKPAGYMESRCRYEKIELTPEVNNTIRQLQEQAKNSPSTLADNHPKLLVYWPEDEVWYYCVIKHYDYNEDRFVLLYDDGITEDVVLYEEKFILRETLNQTEEVNIDGFTLKITPYEPSEADSFLSDEKSMEDFDDKVVFNRRMEDEIYEKKRNSFANRGSTQSAFIITTKDAEPNRALQIEEDEWDQIYNSKIMTHMFNKNQLACNDQAYVRGNGLNGARAGDRGYPSTRSTSNLASNLSREWVVAWRQKHMIPSAQRIRRDMEAFEKKFYERYLSSGYKYCECSVCDSLELKFMIKEDRDPSDFKYLHQKYLEKKINKENIVRRNGIYQNHTIIFLNKNNS